MGHILPQSARNAVMHNSLKILHTHFTSLLQNIEPIIRTKTVAMARNLAILVEGDSVAYEIHGLRPHGWLLYHISLYALNYDGWNPSDPSFEGE